MRKILSLFLAVSMAVGLLAVSVSAAPKVLFQDDFSNANLAEKWTNPVLDDDPGTDDNECKNVAEVKDGKLVLNNIPQFGSFFYLSPKDLKLKDFTLTFKVKANVFNTGWVGISFRKEMNDRFNGCNNNMIAFDFGKKGNPSPVIYARCYRGYPGSSPVELINKTDINGSSKTPLFYKGDVAKEHAVRLEVKDTNFKAYMDGQLLGDWDYKKNKNEGFLSINCCLFDGYVDDIVITEYEALPAPKPVDPQPEKTTAKPDSKTTAAVPDKTQPAPAETTAAPAGEVTTTAPSAAEPTVPQTTAPVPEELSANDILKRKYEDITVDYTFSSIRLSKKLDVAGLLDSFKVAEGYTLQVVDAAGTAVTDTAAAVAEGMKLQVMKDGEPAYVYDVVLDVANDKTPAEADSGMPGWAIALIVVAVIAVIAAVVLFVLYKKGMLSKKAK